MDQTVAVYVQHKVMPRDTEGDAMHLSPAPRYVCGTRVTWNDHHLANPDELDRIRRLNPLWMTSNGGKGESHDSFVERARQYHGRTGRWPADPPLDEVAEMRRRVRAGHGNDYRKVLQWYLDMDEQDAESDKGVPDESAHVSS